MLAWGAVEKEKEISVIFLLVKLEIFFWCSSVADSFVSSHISMKDTAKYKKPESDKIVNSDRARVFWWYTFNLQRCQWIKEDHGKEVPVNDGRVTSGPFLAAVPPSYDAFMWIFPEFTGKEKQIQSLVAKFKMATAFSRIIPHTVYKQADRGSRLPASINLVNASRLAEIFWNSQ